MTMENNCSLLDLFVPPSEKYFGDFGMMCGFTASRSVLEQIKNRFSADTSRPVLAAFIHPTCNAISDIPGLAWVWMKTDPKDRGFALLHAKVALLGFRQRGGEGYAIRLAVCTGNWTQDPLTNSIDLYWAIDLNVNSLEQYPQDCVDVQAAWQLFKWLREEKRSNSGLLKRTYDGRLTDAYLSKWIEKVSVASKGPQGSPQSRFIDSRDQGLMPQIVGRMVAYRRKRNRLIIGSGFFGSKSDGLTVPEQVKQELKSKLASGANLEIILNSDACQGLADPIVQERLQKANWVLKSPSSAMHHNKDAKLHAKFILLASGEGRTDDCNGQLYLGSGNMTEPGFLNKVGANGNLEVGVVFDLPTGLPWKTRRGVNGMDRLLPIDGNEIEPTQLSVGADYEEPIEPDALPPVSYFLWNDGCLECPQDANTHVEIVGHDGETKKLSPGSPCCWPDAPPLTVKLVHGGWLIPVVTDGALVTPKLRDMTIEDVLAGLTGFPEPAERDSDTDRDIEDGVFSPVGDKSDKPEPTYAIRRMMGLLVPLTQVQAKVAPNDWQRWCRELQEGLTAIAKYEETTIGFFRAAGANPLGALLDWRMRLSGVDLLLLRDSLERVTECWGMNNKDHPCLWSSEKEAT